MRMTGRILLFASLFGTCATLAVAQGNYRAQLRGVVSDASGAVVPNAVVTITDAGTNISSSAHTDDKGSFFFTGLRPSTYSVKAEARGFRTAERTNSIGESEMLQHGSPNRTVSAFAKIYPKIPEKYGFHQQTPNAFLIFLPDNSGPGPVGMVVLPWAPCGYSSSAGIVGKPKVS